MPSPRPIFSNFLPEKIFGLPKRIVEKKLKCAKKVTKLPALTVAVGLKWTRSVKINTDTEKTRKSNLSMVTFTFYIDFRNLYLQIEIIRLLRRQWVKNIPLLIHKIWPYGPLELKEGLGEKKKIIWIAAEAKRSISSDCTKAYIGSYKSQRDDKTMSGTLPSAGSAVRIQSRAFLPCSARPASLQVLRTVNSYRQAVLRIRIHMFLGLPDPDPQVRYGDPDPDPLVRGMGIRIRILLSSCKNSKKNLGS
jgi:hypothetical protein